MTTWPPRLPSKPPDLAPEMEDTVTALLMAMEHRERQRAADSAVLESAAKKANSLKAIAAAVLFFGSLFAGAVVTFKELQDKPTTKEVHSIAETHVEPVRKEAHKVEDVAEDVDEIKEDLDRVEKVQDYSLEQSAWQGDVLIHVAERKRTKPPAKPESLKRKERELMKGR